MLGRADYRLLMLAACLGTGVALADPMQFQLAGNGGNCSFCEWIAADGEITADTPAEFERFVTKNVCTTVFFNSPGGDLIAGLRLGSLIRKHCNGTDVGKTVPESDPELAHIETVESGVCASACVFSFLGGRERNAEPGTLLVHQFYSEAGIMKPLEPVFSQADLSLTQALTGLLVAYVMSMEADARLVTLMTQTPPDELRALDASELEQLRVNYSESRLGRLSLELVMGRLDGVAKAASGEQLTLFCADGALQIQLTTPAASEEDRARTEQLKEGLGSISLNGTVMDRDRVSITWMAGKQWLLVTLPDILPQTVGALQWEADVANAYRDDVSFVINEPEFWEKANLLNRLCRA